VSYYEKVLQPGETVRQVGRLHWILYWRAILALIAAVVVLVLALGSNNPQWQWIGIYVALAIGAVTLLLWLAAMWRRLGTEIVLTDHRVIYKRGFISRYTVEMNVSKIETVDVTQSFWGRLFDYGTVVIRGTGSTIEPLSMVAAPLKLRGAIVIG
jgi:uncharacterized membrane protein YdbT with pleckstrin-like domain